jgi:hypothetical protein
MGPEPVSAADAWVRNEAFLAEHLKSDQLKVCE